MVTGEHSFSTTYGIIHQNRRELGCYIVHGQTTHPCRVSIRTPDYTNLQAVHVLSTDHYVADLIATLGTADIVLGSVDKIKEYRCCIPGAAVKGVYRCVLNLP